MLDGAPTSKSVSGGASNDERMPGGEHEVHERGELQPRLAHLPRGEREHDAFGRERVGEVRAGEDVGDADGDRGERDRPEQRPELALRAQPQRDGDRAVRGSGDEQRRFPRGAPPAGPNSCDGREPGQADARRG